MGSNFFFLKKRCLKCECTLSKGKGKEENEGNRMERKGRCWGYGSSLVTYYRLNCKRCVGETEGKT